MTTATEIVTDAMEWLNKLSPGETLNADDLARGLARLNTIVDKLSAKAPTLFKSVITSAAQTGNITLAAGSWAAIPSGTVIAHLAVDGLEIAQITMAQYLALYDTTITGTPTQWAHDGMANIYLYPVATGQTIKTLHRVSVSSFADATTDYTLAPGFKAYLGIELACSLAPSITGKDPSGSLIRERRDARAVVGNLAPAVIDYHGYGQIVHYDNILNG